MKDPWTFDLDLGDFINTLATDNLSLVKEIIVWSDDKNSHINILTSSAKDSNKTLAHLTSLEKITFLCPIFELGQNLFKDNQAGFTMNV
jgi:hypothetical protein